MPRWPPSSSASSPTRAGTSSGARPTPYSDVSEDDWYNNAVSTLTNAGIIDGYEDGTFKPNGNITRAEFATIAVRFFEATYEGENLFPDIDGHWAQDYINEAANAGIVDGYPDGTFGPQSSSPGPRP